MFDTKLQSVSTVLKQSSHLITGLISTTRGIRTNFTTVIKAPMPTIVKASRRTLQQVYRGGASLPILTMGAGKVRLCSTKRQGTCLRLFGTFTQRGRPIRTNGAKILKVAPRSIDSLGTTSGVHRGFHTEKRETIYCKVKSKLSRMGGTSSTRGGVIISPTTLRYTECLRGAFKAPCRIKCPLTRRLIPSVSCAKGGVLVIRRRIVTNSVERRLQGHNTSKRVAITD